MMNNDVQNIESVDMVATNWRLLNWIEFEFNQNNKLIM